MMTTEEILAAASQRAQKMGLPYVGALLPREAHQLWQDVSGATLVDVRTRAEWYWVGRIPGAVEIELQTYPGTQPNPAFLAELDQLVAKTGPVMFICRSGGSSHHAAALATHYGYSPCFNVLEGFEGDRDANGHRNTVNGWRAAGLPWVQG